MSHPSFAICVHSLVPRPFPPPVFQYENGRMVTEGFPDSLLIPDTVFMPLTFAPLVFLWGGGGGGGSQIIINKRVT